MSGEEKEIFKYMTKLSEAIHEGRITEAENYIGALISFSVSALGEDSDIAQDLKDYEEEEENKKYRKIKEARELPTIAKRNRKRTQTRTDYVCSMRDELWRILSEKELFPE